MGLYYTPHALHVAATAAADELDLLRHSPTADDVREMRDGMLMDATLQAILRGHARMGSGGRCGDCEVVVFQTKQKGLSDEQWRRMFPDVDLIHDKVLAPEVPLTGRLQELATIVERRLAAGDTELSNSSLYDELGISKQQFAGLVRRDAWKAHTKNLGLTSRSISAREVGLVRVADG
jgi:hypothetical protein